VEHRGESRPIRIEAVGARQPGREPRDAQDVRAAMPLSEPLAHAAREPDEVATAQ
jgi:hypothetical protein